MENTDKPHHLKGFLPCFTTGGYRPRVCRTMQRFGSLKFQGARDLWVKGKATAVMGIFCWLLRVKYEKFSSRNDVNQKSTWDRIHWSIYTSSDSQVIEIQSGGKGILPKGHPFFSVTSEGNQAIDSWIKSIEPTSTHIKQHHFNRSKPPKADLMDGVWCRLLSLRLSWKLFIYYKCIRGLKLSPKWDDKTQLARHFSNGMMGQVVLEKKSSLSWSML